MWKLCIYSSRYTIHPKWDCICWLLQYADSIIFWKEMVTLIGLRSTSIWHCTSRLWWPNCCTQFLFYPPPPWLQGTGDFWKYSFRGSLGAGPLGRYPKSRRGAEKFDKFCKSVKKILLRREGGVGSFLDVWLKWKYLSLLNRRFSRNEDITPCQKFIELWWSAVTQQKEFGQNLVILVHIFLGFLLYKLKNLCK